ncbi:thermonuclease family protein [Microbacterium sp. BK668]|uniref:thermonuclease family protein n=1 Tax=Microbacterium sp. BK668 TaxID=2512118 RepID=UPI0010D40CEE|nr:thermonuclease family protein [Microbacterium sp. BK668]TDN90642.1 endonuclease YncB(thermonuclease family) [Microbacterium sp. BK668]
MTTRVLIAVLVLVVAGGVAWWYGMRDEATVAPSASAAPTAPAAMPAPPDEAFRMTVESVHDGDTLRAHVDAPNRVVTDLSSTRVRLLGVDTPEISPEPECWSAEATARLAELTPPGSTIWVAPDVEPLDRYGRHLLYVWTPDGRFVNGELVARGDARTEVYAPNTLHEPLLRSLEAGAHAASSGRWGACG